MNKKNDKFSKSILLTIFLISISVVVYATKADKDDIKTNKEIGEVHYNYIDKVNKEKVIVENQEDEEDLAGGDILVSDDIIKEYTKYLGESTGTGTAAVITSKDQENEIRGIQKKNTKTTKQKETVDIEKIDMPKEHQEYLQKLCRERNLDYTKILAIIALESNFNSQLISETNDYGYMQVNKVNHERMAKTLGTRNAPLDPYVNLNWGTYLLAELYDKWRAEGISDKVKDGETFSQLDKYVMSSYNKGINGFKKYGMASRYISLAEGRYRKITR